MGLFEVLGEFVNWLGTLLPRWALIRSTQGAVVFHRKGERIIRGPKIIWWLPCMSDLEIIPVKRQVIDLPPQTLMTKNVEADEAAGIVAQKGVSVIAGAVVVYDVEDVGKYLVDNHDADQSLVEVAGAAVRDAIVCKTLDEIQETDGRKKIDGRLTSHAQETLKVFGVRIERMRLTDFSTAQIINYVGALIPGVLQEETED